MIFCICTHECLEGLLTHQFRKTKQILMKRQLLILVFILVGLCGFSQISSWETVKGPYGGDVTLTDGHNGKLYAQSFSKKNKVYVSSDNGNSWEITLGFPEQLGSSNKRFIGYSGTFFYKNGSWYRSTDEGVTWNALSGVTSLLVETESGALIGWNPSTHEIYRSTNGGQLWDLVASMPVTDEVGTSTSLTIYPGALVATTKGLIETPIYVSLDDGQNWERTLVPAENKLKFVSPSGAMFFSSFAGSGDANLYRKADQNAPLELVSDYIPDGYTVLSSGRLLAKIVSKLHYSDDDGLTWTNTEVYMGDMDLISLKQLNDGSIFGTSSGLYKTLDEGLNWTFSGSGIREGLIVDIKYITDSIYLTLANVGLYRTENDGNDWTLIAEQLSTNPNVFDLTSSGGAVFIYQNALKFSSEGNGNYVDITPPQAPQGVSSVFVNPNNDHIYLSTSQGLFRSTDLGQSWTIDEDITGIKKIIFLPSGRILTCTYSNLFASDDNGNTWIFIANPFPSPYTALENLFLSPLGTVYLFPDGSGIVEKPIIMRSDDQGDSWYPGSQMPDVSLTEGMVFTQNNQIYIIHFGYVYLSVNEGLTWQTIGPTPTNYAAIFTSISPGQKFFLQGISADCYRSSSPLTQGSYLEGNIKVDADADCSTEDAQMPVRNRNVEAIGNINSYYTTSDPDGHYIFFLDTSNYEVVVQNPSGIWWDYCEDTIPVIISDYDTRDTVDFAAIPLSDCPLMTVDVAIPIMRRCFENEVFVNYCNQGTEPAQDAWVDVFLDPFLSFVSSGQPNQSLGNNVYRFLLGDVDPGECGQFQLTAYLNCDSTIIGQTHCVSAHGFPDTLCVPVNEWSGAEIKATATCQDTLIQLQLENEGSAPSQILDYIIIEDDVMLDSGSKDFGIGEVFTLNYTANGSTWRIESEQEPGHPFSTLAIAFAEGCGGFGSLGYINQFSVNGVQPSWHRTCVENTGSYDPNDKQGFPNGFGDEHNIRPGQSIDYLIRFQNTGNDTAFTVRIVDTLSQFLDPATIRPGASSHPYTWKLSGQGEITFTFPNIMLPDSNINEAASHGFVQFNIKQRPNVEIGSIIENQAAIYFDFNDPVLTNTTWHTVRDEIPTSGIQNPTLISTSNLEIWPNPCHETAYISLKQKTSNLYNLKIFNQFGLVVSQNSSTSPILELNTSELPSGIYMAELRDAGTGILLGSRKFVKI